MNRRVRKRIKSVTVETMAVSCAFGFMTLLIQPKYPSKGMLLGFGFGLCCGIKFTED
ncbi:MULTISPECIES: hypothetical protein [Cyanophyceae]|uniref:hypothetical protein n=1 Tax=Cyanophyceae TaxID=3028117 RepID=UPI0016826C54|nr:hypothetical protein [Trichocoleus sp. FACHB-40]MBD2006360.1 hypothetical protein [Trichocoleus sp. FACHB-40]